MRPVLNLGDRETPCNYQHPSLSPLVRPGGLHRVDGLALPEWPESRARCTLLRLIRSEALGPHIRGWAFGLSARERQPPVPSLTGDCRGEVPGGLVGERRDRPHHCPAAGSRAEGDVLRRRLVRVERDCGITPLDRRTLCELQLHAPESGTLRLGRDGHVVEQQRIALLLQRDDPLNAPLAVGTVHLPLLDQRVIVIEHGAGLTTDAGDVVGVGCLDDRLDGGEIIASGEMRA